MWHPTTRGGESAIAALIAVALFLLIFGVIAPAYRWLRRQVAYWRVCRVEGHYWWPNEATATACQRCGRPHVPPPYWIACAEQLPNMRAGEFGRSSDEVLTRDSSGCIDVRRLEQILRQVRVGRTTEETWGVPEWSNVDRGDVDYARVTHWMPLPAPPETP